MSLSKFVGSTALLPEINDSAYHPPPSFKFPTREFGKKYVVKRSFQHSWFQKWHWIHYDENNDAAFCHNCVKACKEKKLISSNAESAFITKGFTNWKDASVKFKEHANSKCHTDAMLVTVTLQATPDIGEVLNRQTIKEKEQQRDVLLKILSTVKYLGPQGIPLRGNEDSNSNFIQLLKLWTEDDPRIQETMEHKVNKYTSPQIQNEMLSILAKTVSLMSYVICFHF